MKKKLHIGIRNELQAGSSLELYFLDGIYDYLDYEEWTFVNLVEDVINRVNKARPNEIIAYINSEGGSCEIGLAIYAFLKHHKASVETRTLAMAGSIASILQQAADPGRRYIAKTAMMVIHKAWGYGMGTANELRQAADVVDLYTGTIVDIYAEVSARPREEFVNLIEPGDYWMTGEQSIAQGLADHLFDDLPEGISLQNCLQDLDPHYTNVPENLKKLIIPNSSGLNNNANQHSMTFKERMAAFSASLKGKKINRDAPNLAEEVANVISEPMQEMLEGMQADVDERIAAQTQDITAAVTTAVTDSLKGQIDSLTQANTDLTTKLGGLEETNGKLVQELSDLKGGESTDKGGEQNSVKPIGRGIKAA